MSETKKPKRHDWRPGLVQHCGNVGCSWHRRAKMSPEGLALGGWQYRNPSVGWTTWMKKRRVPACGGKA